MANKTPVMVRTTTGYTDPLNSVYGGVNPIDEELTTNGTHHANKAGFRMTIHYFDNIDTTDTWTSNMSGIVAVAWQGDAGQADRVGVTLTSAPTGVVTFDPAADNSNGWLWVLSKS